LSIHQLGKVFTGWVRVAIFAMYVADAQRRFGTAKGGSNEQARARFMGDHGGNGRLIADSPLTGARKIVIGSSADGGLRRLFRCHAGSTRRLFHDTTRLLRV
jgi:hypothetical protein